MNRHNNKIIKACMLFSPSLALMAVFYILPILITVFFAFTNISLTGSSARAMQFVGFKNFLWVFEDPRFGTIIYNTMIFLFASGIVGQQVLGFFIAYFMRGKNIFVRRFTGFTVIAGWITPELIAAFMFSAFFADKGSLNSLLGIFGASPVTWIFSFPMVCVVVANIWKGTAYSMMMFQASLDTIPDELSDAAEIDGVNAIQMLFKIILPIIKGALGTTFIVVTLGTLGAFGLLFAMTGGGPGVSTTTLSLFMYQRAFVAYQIGAGMAIALMILLIGVTLSSLYVKSIKAT